MTGVVGPGSTDPIALLGLGLSVIVATVQAVSVGSAQVVLTQHGPTTGGGPPRLELSNIGRGPARKVMLREEDRTSRTLGVYVERLFPIDVIGAGASFVVPLPTVPEGRLVAYKVTWRSHRWWRRHSRTVLWMGESPPGSH